MASLAQMGYQGTTAPYYIRNGKLVTPFGDMGFEAIFYKLGDTCYVVRSAVVQFSADPTRPTPKPAGRFAERTSRH
jgi:hypothetical protein